jgi:predicted nucleic acid-binding protein
LENSKNPNPERREAIGATLDNCTVEIRMDEKRIERCQELLQMDFPVYDAFHLASAEAAGADVFFTTDDRLLARVRKNRQSILLPVENPLKWLSENNL